MQKAIGLGVTGWIRNLPDGRVEAIFEGEKESVNSLVDFCKRGPRGAVVQDTSISWEPFLNEFKEFSVRR